MYIRQLEKVFPAFCAGIYPITCPFRLQQYSESIIQCKVCSIAKRIVHKGKGEAKESQNGHNTIHYIVGK